jgi:hypothetical protein
MTDCSADAEQLLRRLPQLLPRLRRLVLLRSVALAEQQRLQLKAMLPLLHEFPYE